MNNPARRMPAAPARFPWERISPAGWLVATGGGAALWLVLLSALRALPHQ